MTRGQKEGNPRQSQAYCWLFCPEMKLEAYEQAIKDTVFLRIVSCDDKGAKGDIIKREISGAVNALKTQGRSQLTFNSGLDPITRFLLTRPG